jgi:hypothetical protein
MWLTRFAIKNPMIVTLVGFRRSNRPRTPELAEEAHELAQV